mmetsp:Transcript_21281/g.66742  ORF Transcript_21281/g.66742 Transcript_21281/m.66742 type:complete len:123 (+) Transcript_21281:980-1348(+)
MEAERKSTTGYTVYLFNCLVSWKSKLQPIIATSTHEAELIALGTCADEAIWIRKLLRELGFAINHHFWKHHPASTDEQTQQAKDDHHLLTRLPELSRAADEYLTNDTDVLPTIRSLVIVPKP